jgi:hypothetical protein
VCQPCASSGPRLQQDVRDRDGPEPRVCDTSYPQYRGDRLEVQLARASSHEAMQRERLDAYRGKARSRKALAATKDRWRTPWPAKVLTDDLVRATEEGVTLPWPFES